ncbi:MarR family winged helix-turn-helix transcriptional regulator [Dongia sp. agr-C8]
MASRGGRAAGQGATEPGEVFAQWPEGVDFGPLAGLIGYALRRAQIAIYRDFFATVADLGFTPQLFAALVLIDRNPALNQSDLGRVMGVNRAAAMALVKRLEAMKLVARQTSDTDKRSNSVGLTRLGRARLATLVEKVQAHDRRAARNLNAAELEMLRRLLGKF